MAATGAGLSQAGCAPVAPAPYIEAVVEAVTGAGGTVGTLTIPVARYPDLARVGGAVTVRLTAQAGVTATLPPGGLLLIHRGTAVK